MSLGNKISVIVPCYNVEWCLDRCVASLVNQTLREIEIILVDGDDYIDPDTYRVAYEEVVERDPSVDAVFFGMCRHIQANTL